MDMDMDMHIFLGIMLYGHGSWTWRMPRHGHGHGYGHGDMVHGHSGFHVIPWIMLHHMLSDGPRAAPARNGSK